MRNGHGHQHLQQPVRPGSGCGYALSASGGTGATEGFLGISRTVTDTSWRTGSQRYVVMFGDTNNGGNTPFADDNAAAALAALQQQNVHLLGVNDNTQTPNSFASTYNAIAQSSGGSMHYFNGSNGNAIANAIADTILNGSLHNPTFEQYNSVCLFSQAPAGVAVDLAPECITGDFDRSVTRTFDFDVNLTGVNEGTYSFLTHAVVGGAQVAGTQRGNITVTAPVVATVPEPSALTLLSLVLAGLSINAFGRRERAPVKAGARLA